MTEKAGDGTSTLSLTITVARSSTAGSASRPISRRYGRASDTFDYTLTVTNNTPAAQTFTFAAQGPQGWTVTASPNAAANANTVTVDADGTTQVKVTATPPDTVNAGQYPIAVTISSDSGATDKCS